MKKTSFTLTTALISAVGAAFPSRAEMVINTGDSITNSDLAFIGMMDEDNHRPIVAYQEMLKVDGGSLDVQLVHMDVGTVQIKSGSVKSDDAYITTHGGEFYITGGNIKLSNNGGFESGNMDISGNTVIDMDASEFELDYGFSLTGGTVNLANASYISAEPEDEDYTNSKFVVTGGTINMSGGDNFLSHGYYNDEDEVLTARDADLSGGTINIKSGKNYWFFKNANIGGTLNIAADSTLSLYSGYSETSNAQTIDDVKLGDKSTLKLLSSGILNLSGTLNSNVINGGSLNVMSTAAKLNGNLTVNSGGLVDLSANKLTVGGNVAFNEGATLQTTLINKDYFGAIKADNITIANTNTTLKMAFNGGVVAKNETIRLKILDVANVDGEFANLPENARYDIKYLGNGTYEITGVGDTGDIIDDNGGDQSGDNSGTDDSGANQGNNNSGGDNADTDSQETQNMKSTAEAWDNFTPNAQSSKTAVAVAQKLAELSNSTVAADRKAYKEALIALSPDTTPAIQASQMQIANQVFNAFGTRMSGGSYSGRMYGVASGDGSSGGAIWVQGMLNRAKYDKTETTEFDADTWGTAAGLEIPLGHALKVGAGYAYSKTDIDGFNRDTDVKTHTAIVYGEIKPDDWFLNVIASYGWSDYQEKKKVDNVEVSADYDVETLGLQAMTGYDIHSQTTGIIVTPEAGLRYFHIKNKEYTDSADQKIANSDSNILTGVLGFKFAKQYRVIGTDMRLKPEARVAITYDIEYDGTKSTVTLPNKAVYNVEGKPLKDFGTEVGAGFTADFSNTMEMYFGYEGKFRSDYQDHTGLINAKIKF